MPTITVTPRTYDRLTDVARARGISDEAAIIWLLDFWKEAASDSQGDGDRVPIHVVYLGERVDGIYHPSTGLIDITAGPVPAATGLKPSPAAREVIQTINKAQGKEVGGSRNGWGFWTVTSSREPLQSIRKG